MSPWGRAIDFTTFRAAAEFFIDNLNTWADPRLARFNTQARTQNGSATIGYKGIPSAYAGSDAQFQYQPSNFNVALVTATAAAPMPSVLMTYAEVEFIKAEAAQRGYTTADARTALRAGREGSGGAVGGHFAGYLLPKPGRRLQRHAGAHYAPEVLRAVFQRLPAVV